LAEAGQEVEIPLPPGLDRSEWWNYSTGLNKFSFVCCCQLEEMARRRCFAPSRPWQCTAGKPHGVANPTSRLGQARALLKRLHHAHLIWPLAHSRRHLSSPLDPHEFTEHLIRPNMTTKAVWSESSFRRESDRALSWCC
jgi:hypothetical protein